MNPSEPFGAWAGPRDARCVFVGEAWGREEEACGEPFVGAAGKELWRLLGEAQPDLWPEEHRRVLATQAFGTGWIRQRGDWLRYAQIAFTNVLNLRPQDNKIANLCGSKTEMGSAYQLPAIETGKYLRPEYLPQLDRLFVELASVRPNLVVALGNKACWALLRATNISQIRGTTMQATVNSSDIRQTRSDIRQTLKVLPTWHPAGLLYEGQWSRRPILLADLMKAARESGFAEIRRPARQIRIQPESIEEWESWTQGVLQRPPALLGCDTETALGQIDTIGFSTSREAGFACQIGPHRVRRGDSYLTVWPRRGGQQVSSYWNFNEEKRFWASVRGLLESPIPLLFQNGMYDLQYLLRLGLRPKNVAEDLMLLHHSLFPELPKGLGFLGSIYSDESSWKLMRRQADTERSDE